MSTFWDTKPIIGLAPMDGVTDGAFRAIVDTCSHPDILYTEFVAVEGLAHNAVQILNQFIYHETKTPIIGQIYGIPLEDFYHAALIVCALGFDGVDINMGCPDKSVSGRGAGAGLIRTPTHAQEIIQTVQKAVKDWSEGIELSNTKLRPKMIERIAYLNAKMNRSPKRKMIPVSVKTRIGFEGKETLAWIPYILECEPVALAIHGRTLRQMYTGLADWEEIGKAARLGRGSKTYILGNGDIKSKEEAQKRISQYDLHGALIGRASFGNPWIFSGEKPPIAERLKGALTHVRIFSELTPENHFASLRKHMAWYCQGFDGAAAVRAELMTINTYEDAARILEPHIKVLEGAREAS